MSASERRIAQLEQDLATAEQKIAQLRHLLSQQMRTGEELEFEAIVNTAGKPLMNLRWDQLATQFPIEQARRMAMSMLEVCTWAETDAKLYRFLRERDFDEDAIGGFMAMVRDGRGGSSDVSGAGGVA